MQQLKAKKDKQQQNVLELLHMRKQIWQMSNLFPRCWFFRFLDLVSFCFHCLLGAPFQAKCEGGGESEQPLWLGLYKCQWRLQLHLFVACAPQLLNIYFLSYFVNSPSQVVINSRDFDQAPCKAMAIFPSFSRSYLQMQTAKFAYLCHQQLSISVKLPILLSFVCWQVQ